MRGDRMSAYTQFPLALEDALRCELVYGLGSVNAGEARQGAAQFAHVRFCSSSNASSSFPSLPAGEPVD